MKFLRHYQLLHALIGHDFTPAFYRKQKQKVCQVQELQKKKYSHCQCSSLKYFVSNAVMHIPNTNIPTPKRESEV